jgi:uncharacterized protein YraI
LQPERALPTGGHRLGNNDRGIGWRLWLIIAIIAGLALAPRGTDASESATVVTDVLNLRSGPGTWADVVDKMWWGEPVEVIGGPTEDGWYEVLYYGEYGWAYGGYLSIGGWASEGTSAGGANYYGLTAWVATDRLRVRAWGSTEAQIYDRVYQGESVLITGSESNGFVPISYDRGEGWVALDYLSFEPVSASSVSYQEAAPEPGPEHWIDINRGSSIVSLMVGDSAIATYGASLGWDQSADGFYSTAIGTYYVYGMHAGLTWTEWGQAYIKYWVGFDPSRVNGFHSWSMDASGNVLPNGDGPTGGCVALEPSAAANLYDFAYEGMRVEVHW